MSNVRTKIISNGGGTKQPIEALIARLKSDTLDPTFEDYGDFASVIPGGGVHFFGNFWSYSHVFNVRTTDGELIAVLMDLIRANKATLAYKEARDAVQAERVRRAKEVQDREARLHAGRVNELRRLTGER